MHSRTFSGVAGGSRRGQSSWSAVLAIASEIACSTEIASIKGGSPTALDLKIVLSRFAAPSSRRTLNTCGRSEQAGIL